MALHWLEEIQEVSSVGLTVQAQALSLDQVDPTKMLQHPVFFPYADTTSVSLDTVFETDYRPTADRREWDAPGRFIPTVLPEIEKLSMVPIESNDKIGEEEMQKIEEQAQGNQDIYRRLATVTIPARVDKLVKANFRRAELDAMEAWSKGTITAKNPTKGGDAQVYSLGFAAGRIQTAGTAWSDGGVNAFNELMSWIEDGEQEVGPIIAVKLRRAIFNAIQTDAPNILDFGGNSIKPSPAQVSQRVTDMLGHSFRFIISEERVDTFTDGGTAYSRTAVWPSQWAAAVPQSGVLGATFRAPVVRGGELARSAPDAGIDVRGQTVYYNFKNNGRTAVIECQCNWLSLPQERNVWTIDTGIASS